MTKHEPHHFAKDQTGSRQEIADYMSSPVLSLNSSATVKEAARMMDENNLGSLLVKGSEDFEGILTETDLTRKVLGKGLDPSTTQITEVMSQPIQSLDCHLPVTEANSFMAQKKIRHLAITDNGKIVGMLSVRDLVSYFANPRLR